MIRNALLVAALAFGFYTIFLAIWLLHRCL